MTLNSNQTSPYVSCSGSDITQINFDSSITGVILNGYLSLNNGYNKWPSTLTSLNLNQNSISGYFYLQSFNQSININAIAIANNQFYGQLDFSSIQYLNL